MKKYRAYTQKDWNAEKFYIEDPEENGIIIEAEDEDLAFECFIDYIYDTSLYSHDETEEWLDDNPLYVEEVKNESL